MKVLMITGDRSLLKEGSNAWERLQLQRGAVEKLDVVYWGRGALMNVFFARGKYDVVTTHDPLFRGLVGLFIARKLSARLNVQVHMDLSSLSATRRMFARCVLRHADTIRVVSEKIKVQVEDGKVEAKITVLPVFVDIEKFRNVARRKHDGKNILWLGRFEKEKNPLQAIATFRDVLKSIPEASLILLGSGSMFEKLTEHGKGLPVRIEKWQDPVSFFEIADVVLSTSNYESWGSSIVEALAAGVPVVAPDVGIAKEAGAIVVSREKLAEAVVDTLQQGGQGVLKLPLLPAHMWTVQWRQSLI